MPNADDSQSYPSFLIDYASLLSHIQGQFEGLSSQEKGAKFASFAQNIIRHTDIGKSFDTPEQRQPTHDEGVDFECESLDGKQTLFAQSKYTVRDADGLALIFDKFSSFESKYRQSGRPPDQIPMWGPQQPKSETDPREKFIRFMIVSIAQIEGTDKLSKFASSRRESARFYEKVKSEGRLHIIDGPKVFPIARAIYAKRHVLPSNIMLQLATPYVTLDNVFVSIMHGNELCRLYDQYGDSLFLENLREWLGPTTGKKPMTGRETVNQAISKTLKNEPSKLLARNNGITFRAGKVTPQGNTILLLDEGSIVNGCQTTMSVVQENPNSRDHYVLVKIVETNDAWDIAASANFQTKVDRIDLDIARYIRPQALSMAADKFGYKLKKPEDQPDSLFAAFDSIALAEIAEDEIRALFIGFFSRTPNNAVEVNYSDLRNDILEGYGTDPDKESILQILFELNKASKKASEMLVASQEQTKDPRRSSTLPDLFHRFWRDSSKHGPSYRAILSILAACGWVGQNPYDPKTPVRTYSEMKEFLKRIEVALTNEPQVFEKQYHKAFSALALKAIEADSPPEKILQNMYGNIKEARFQNLYLMMEAMGR